jgi:hypothetical protein
LFTKDWRRVLKRAWSIRLMLLAGLLSGLEVALPLLGGLFDVPHGALAGISGLTVAGAFVTRLLAQKGYDDET